MSRAEVVATARAMAAEGLVAGSEGNVSVREGDLVHITPALLPYGEMEAADLVTLDLSGRVVAGEREPSSERAVHLAIYAARPDVRAIVHTHSPAATQLGFTGGISATTSIAAHADPGTTSSPRGHGRARDRRAALMARHGVVAVGGTLEEALTWRAGSRPPLCDRAHTSRVSSIRPTMDTFVLRDGTRLTIRPIRATTRPS